MKVSKNTINSAIAHIEFSDATVFFCEGDQSESVSLVPQFYDGLKFRFQFYAGKVLVAAEGVDYKGYAPLQGKYVIRSHDTPVDIYCNYFDNRFGILWMRGKLDIYSEMSEAVDLQQR